MSKPCLIINGRDYAEFLSDFKPVDNDLDADGSGRDVQTGEMARTKLAEKQTYELSFNRIYEDDQKPLSNAIRQQYYHATILDPNTGTRVTKTFFTATRAFGSQRYDKFAGKTYYDGMAFKMTEK